MKQLHYFNQDKPDPKDFQLAMAKGQGYVPQGCLLNGLLVMGDVMAGKDPCAGCEGPRHKCNGRAKQNGS